MGALGHAHTHTYEKWHISNLVYELFKMKMSANSREREREEDE